MSIAYDTYTAHRTQFTYCPLDFHFDWIGDWYSWDRTRAIADAKRFRNSGMKAARAQGMKVKAFSISGQRITKGGIGSAHPEVDFVVTIYGFNVIGMESTPVDGD